MTQAATLAPDASVIFELEMGKRFEVVDGRRVEKPPVGNFQAVIAGVIDQLLGGYVRTNRLGRVIPEMLFRINPKGSPQRRPDVAFLSYARWPRDRKVDSRDGLDVIPDLAVEVVSPSNTAEEVVGKVREYFEAGVVLVWIVFPSVRQVYAYRSQKDVTILVEGDVLDAGDLVPGFRLTLAELFEDGVEARAGSGRVGVDPEQA